MTTILIKHLPKLDPRLGRRVHHDSRSLAYPFITDGLTIKSVVYKRNIPILNQGNVGACTANAAIGLLGTDPFFETLPLVLPYSLDEAGALKLYSDEEVFDGEGTYPPNDVGGSGLSVSSVIANAFLTSGTQHTFSANDALKALSKTPVLFGTNWYNSMFNPASDGKLTIGGGGIAGGHELLIREIDAPNERVWLDNSWDISWGIQGRCYISFEDFNTLLNEDGDITIPIPNNQPKPQPVLSKKESLLKEFEGWLEKHI